MPTLIAQRDAMWVEMGRCVPGEPDPTSAAYGDWLLERMQGGRLKAFLAEAPGGEAVGGGALWLQEVQPRPGHPRNFWGYLLSVYTAPSHRGLGIATDIVQRCVDWAKERECTRVCLHASEAGRPMYEKMGFEASPEMWLDVRPPERRPRAAKGLGLVPDVPLPRDGHVNVRGP